MLGAKAAELVHLATLQREADALARIHDLVLQRAREVREEEFFVVADVRLVSAALPPNMPSTPSNPLLAIMGFIAFAMIGTIAALFFGILRDNKTDVPERD